jgi:Fibronectin type III domain
MNKMYRSHKFDFVMALFSLMMFGIAKGASVVSLQWNPNTDPSVTGYNVYYGGASHDYTNSFSVGNTTNTTVGGLVEGKTYFFAVTAYDDYGDESDFSDETIYVVPGFLTLTPGTNPGDPMRIQFPVAPGHWYELQVSTDMRTWSTLWQITGFSNTWLEFDAPNVVGQSQFYRLVLH